MSKSYDARSDRAMLDHKRQVDAERKAQAVLKQRERARQAATAMAFIARGAGRAS